MAGRRDPGRHQYAHNNTSPPDKHAAERATTEKPDEETLSSTTASPTTAHPGASALNCQSSPPLQPPPVGHENSSEQPSIQENKEANKRGSGSESSERVSSDQANPNRDASTPMNRKGKIVCSSQRFIRKKRCRAKWTSKARFPVLKTSNLQRIRLHRNHRLARDARKYQVKRLHRLQEEQHEEKHKHDFNDSNSFLDEDHFDSNNSDSPWEEHDEGYDSNCTVTEKHKNKLDYSPEDGNKQAEDFKTQEDIDNLEDNDYEDHDLMSVLSQLLDWTSSDRKSDDRTWEDYLREKVGTPEWDFYAIRSPIIALTPSFTNQLLFDNSQKRSFSFGRDNEVWRFHYHLSRELGFFAPLPTFMKINFYSTPRAYIHHVKRLYRLAKRSIPMAKRGKCANKKATASKELLNLRTESEPSVSEKSASTLVAFDLNEHTRLIFQMLQTVMIQEIRLSGWINLETLVIILHELYDLYDAESLSDVSDFIRDCSTVENQIPYTASEVTGFSKQYSDEAYINIRRHVLGNYKDRKLLETLGYPSCPVFVKSRIVELFEEHFLKFTDDEERNLLVTPHTGICNIWYDIPDEIKLWYWSKYYRNLQAYNAFSTVWVHRFFKHLEKGDECRVTRGELSRVRRKQASRLKQNKVPLLEGQPGDEFFNMFADSLRRIDDVTIDMIDEKRNEKSPFRYMKNREERGKGKGYETIAIFPHGPKIQRKIPTDDPDSHPKDILSTCYVELEASPSSYCPAPAPADKNPRFFQDFENLVMTLRRTMQDTKDAMEDLKFPAS